MAVLDVAVPCVSVSGASEWSNAFVRVGGPFTYW